MLIKGLQKLTLIDYPKHAAATIFLYGCNFSCPYCHNPELVDKNEAKKAETYSEKEILNFLKERKEFIDGVCISGGEPTLNKNLMSFLSKIKRMKYEIKIDTNGTNPKILKQLIKKKLVDYIAMDVKAPLEKYEEITKTKMNIENIKKSIDIVKKFKNHEFRTTITPELNEQDIVKIAEMINGAKEYYLQQFIPSKCLNKSYNKKSKTSIEYLQQIKSKIHSYFEKCEIRAL